VFCALSRQPPLVTLAPLALDMIIAAVAEANDCIVVTDNERDFAAVQFINPLRSLKRQARLAG